MDKCTKYALDIQTLPRKSSNTAITNFFYCVDTIGSFLIESF